MQRERRQVDKASAQYMKMTETPVTKLILMLGIPTTISMLVTSIYNMADTYFVGQIGTSASGAVGVVFGLMAIIQAFGFMFGHGAGSIVSRSLGAKDAAAGDNAHRFGGLRNNRPQYANTGGSAYNKHGGGDDAQDVLPQRLPAALVQTDSSGIGRLRHRLPNAA